MSMLIGKVEPGDVIGRCRIIRELGRGGVGTVYLAKHQTLQIEVALKVLSPALSLDNPALAERFIREAQLAARIRHPHVIAVMDAAHDEPTGLYYIVFEYVGGGALAWHLRNGPLPETKALAIMCGIAQALVMAEENSIVHRDIKPENIMLDGRGTAKLADLGLAKHDIDSRTSLTLGGSYMGTPAYMSPEQARDAKAADTRDDIYSLGATFYECLTGQPPFVGETPYNIMSELLTKPSPKVSDRRPDVSRSADMICRKMMAKTRALRYGDARALVRDLQHCQTYGDSGLERLEAAAFARDSVMVRQQALAHGVHTAGEEVVSDAMLSRPSMMRNVRQAPPSIPGEEEGALRAALWLVAFVLIATALLAVFGHRFTPAEGIAFAASTNSNAAAEAPPLVEGAKPPSTQAAAEAKPKASHRAEGKTSTPAEKASRLADEHSLVAPRALPVIPPLSLSPGNSISPTSLADTNLAAAGANSSIPSASSSDITNATLVGPPLPVIPTAAPLSAFQARDVAETTLRPQLVDPTGKASLLKIIGQRAATSASPHSWTFYFYDVSAKGNATYLTVRDGQVVRDGEAITSAVFPWHADNVLPEDKLRIDSTDALAAAQALIPAEPISSSTFELVRPHNAAPVWRLTLWTRKQGGQEQEIGDVEILAETGYVVKNNLKLPGA